MERAGGVGSRNTPVTKIGYDVHQEWRPYFHSYRPPGQSGQSQRIYLPARAVFFFLIHNPLFCVFVRISLPAFAD